MANSDLSTSYNKESINQKSVQKEIINRMLKRLMHAGLILLTIAFLSLLGLYLAQRGQEGLPITLGGTLKDTFTSFFSYIFLHPKTYLWHKEAILPIRLVADLFGKSAGLLFTSLILATLIGGGLGLATALIKNRNAAPLLIIASIVGVSTPSFLLAMIFWALNVAVYRFFQLDNVIFPPTGFGWDIHLILPALVLAARPIAQLMQVTNLAVTDILSQDYIRSAKAKGVSDRLILWEHVFPNILIPILTTLGTSLRFSLASLPVVESFFLWPGLGLGILQAIELDMPFLITDLVVALGLMFLLLNAVLDFVYPLLDPRLSDTQQVQQDSGSSLKQQFVSIFRKKKKEKTIASSFEQKKSEIKKTEKKESSFAEKAEAPAYGGGKSILSSFLSNPLLMISGITIFLLFLMAIFGEKIAGGTMVEMNGVMKIEGIILGPPFKPSSVFPWGSDLVGRDILKLVLAGARQTLTLAILATIARVLFGVIFGLLSGWWQNSWFDKFIQAVINVWAAFPNTVFAMILILGMGIQKGMSVFIVALCIIGWDEIAQMVRGQVIQQKPFLYIEAARATGARTRDILINHILPHLFPTILVLMVMEMGSVLMLLAELGYLNIFLGGGFKVEQISGAIYHFSDVPEWGALLSNIRYYWRSYPWMVWGPGAMFFVSILSFNLFGEGLRRFLNETRLVLNKFINRYSLVLILALFVGGIWLFRSNTPFALYKGQALQFNADNTMADIEELTDPKYEGRESGTQGAVEAANYIAARMEEIGLFPAGEHDTYLQMLANPRFQLSRIPELTLTTMDGKDIQLAYREQFVEYVGGDAPGYGIGEGNITALVAGAGDKPERIQYNESANQDRILMLSRADYESILVRGTISGVLIVDDDPTIMDKKYVSPFNTRTNYPILIISPQTADIFMEGSGMTWDSFQSNKERMSTADIRTEEFSTRAYMEITGDSQFSEGDFINVIGYIPGEGALTGERLGDGMDAQVIVVSAYFDGLGNNPESPFVPGANDNASGVAAMLEIARVLKEGNIPPYKTVMFVAWSGGERNGELSEDNILNAKTGFYRLNVESVIELSGVAAGTGNGLSLNPGSSYRLVQVFEESANTMNTSVTTRGRSPHFDWPLGSRLLNRNATTASVSWDGSDQYAHTAMDSIEIIDLEKMQQFGETTTLVVTVISREAEY